MTWKCLSCFNNKSSTVEFLTKLLGADSPELDKLIKKYDTYSPFDIILDDRCTVESLIEFRKLISQKIIKTITTDSLLLFAKQTKSARHVEIIDDKKPKIYESGTPILHANTVDVYPIKESSWAQGTNLLGSLVELESSTYCFEFAQQYDYKGCYKYLRDACTSPCLDNANNYDSLENLGDTILKVISTIHYFFKFEKKNEHQLTTARSRKVSNKHLGATAIKREFFRYLKTNSLKFSKFRPPFYASKSLPGETCEVEHKISEGMLADFVEALIGAFYMGSGLYEATKFIVNTEIIPNDAAWEKTVSYISNDTFTILRPHRLSLFTDKKLPLRDLLPIRFENSYRHDSLESAIGYYFNNKQNLIQALTHCSADPLKNYDRMEFLGDSIIDFIVLSNIFIFGTFTAEELTTLRHILVSNSFLGKLSISIGLHNHIIARKDFEEEIDTFVANAYWDDDLLDFGVHQDDPPKILNDVLEALIGAVLIDSGSLNVTCEIFGELFGDAIMYLVKNREKCQKNISSRLIEFGQQHGMKVEFEEIGEEEELKVAVIVNGEVLLERVAETIWLAKKQASIDALEMLTRENEGQKKL